MVGLRSSNVSALSGVGLGAIEVTQKPTRGRPPTPAADLLKTRTIRLNDADYAELMRRGVDRLRKWLRRADRAKVKE